MAMCDTQTVISRRYLFFYESRVWKLGQPRVTDYKREVHKCKGHTAVFLSLSPEIVPLQRLHCCSFKPRTTACYL